MVQVNFGANTKDLEAGAQRARSSVESLVPSVETTRQSFADLAKSMEDMSSKGGDGIASLSDQLKGLNDTISKGGAGGSSSWLGLLLGGGLVGGAAVGAVEMLRKINSEMLDLQRNAREAGLSLEKFQELNFAANAGGVGNDKFVSGLQEAGKKLNDILHGENDLSKFLDANNIKYKDAAGHLISIDQYLQVAAQLVSNAASEGDKFKAAEILGFSRDWVKVLEQGPVVLRASQAEAHKVGAVIADDVVAKAAAFEEEWRKSSLQWSTLMKSAIVSLTPYIDDLIKKSGELVTSFTKTVEKFRGMSDEDFGKQEIQSWTDLGAAILVSGERLVSYTDKAIGGTAAVTALTLELQAGISDIGANMPSLLVATSQYDQYWKDVVVDAEKAQRAIAAMAASSFPVAGATKFADKDDKDNAAGHARMIDAQITEQQNALVRMKFMFTEEADAYRITQAQKALYTEAAIKQVYDAEMDLVRKKQQLYDEGSVGYGNAERQKARLTEQYEKDMLATVTASRKAMEQTTTQYLNLFTSAFNSQLSALLNRTETWQQAMQKMVQQLFMEMIRQVEQWVVKHAAAIIADSLTQKTAAAADVTTHAAAEAAKTEATLAGTVARTGAETTAAGAGILATLANAIKSIFASAGATDAGVSAAVAPEVGPAAPAVGAAAGAAVLTSALALVPSAAIGGYVMNSGLAMVHANETIVPAQLAQPFAPGGAGGAPQITINASQVDTAGMYAMLKKMAPQIAGVVADAMNRNPSLRPKFT